MSAPSHSERVNAVLACLRRETTYEAIAEQFKVTASEVQGWEASFIAGGSTALNESDRDLVTEMGAINAISQSLVALLDLDELWDATVDNLFWVFGYTSTVALIEGDHIVVKSAYSTEGKRLIGYQGTFPRDAENNLLSQVAQHGRPLNVGDLRDEPGYLQDAKIGEVRSELAMPIIFKGTALGILAVKSAKPQAFSQRDVSILETISVQLAAAIENAQLFDMVRRRIAQLELVRNITTRAIENLDVQSVLNHTVQTTREIIGYTSIAVGLLNDDGISMTLTSVTGTDRKLAPPQNSIMRIDSATFISTAFQTGKLILVSDVQTTPIFAPLLTTTRSVLVVPISSKGQIIGVINVESDRLSAFDESDVATMTILADQLTIAIRGAALFQQTQAQLREISLFRRLADEAIVGILTHDDEGLIDYANPAAVRLFGHDNLTGQSIEAIYNPENHADIQRYLRSDAATWSGEITQTRPSGEMFTADMSMFPIHTPDGVFVTYGTVLSDATESRRLLNEIKGTNARFEAILEATEDAIIVWNEHWRVVLVNPAATKLLGIAYKDLINSTRESWPKDSPMGLLLNKPEGERIEFPGAERRVGWTRNLRWQTESASGYMTVVYDVTSQVALEEAREEMTSMLIHDLRGPITSVVGGIELAQSVLEENRGQEVALRFMNLSAKSGMLLLDMADSLLDMSKFEAGHLMLSAKPLVIETLFSHVSGVFAAAAESANIKIEVECDPDLPQIHADTSMIRRAISNLLDNALKFSPDGQSVTISAHSEGPQMIRFSVADRGKGIPEAYRKDIFEKYSQIPKSEGRRRGTGLGLAFCRLVAEAHHGKIWIDGRPGGGSVFSFTVADVQVNPEPVS